MKKWSSLKSLKRLLLFCLLLPVSPILGIPEGDDPDGEGAGKEGAGAGKDTDAKDKDKDKDGGDAGAGKDTDAKDKDKDLDKLFTQDELDAVISRRLERERKVWEKKIEDEKKKAAMTESERLKTEKEEAEKKADEVTQRANQRLIRSEVIAQATKMNIVDADAAFALMDRDSITVDDTTDAVTGVKEALTILVKAKPYLIQKDKDTKKTGDDTSADKQKKSGFSMNDLIRKASGRT